jgi:type II secretory pathway component GspD/PulD (secretin)
MKISIMRIFCIFWLLVFCSSICFGNDRLYAASENDQTWSFDFNEQTMADILCQMSADCGIEFHIDRRYEKKLFSGSFKDLTVDQMLGKLFQHENHALVCRYETDQLKAVDIWIFADKTKAAYQSKGKPENLRPHPIKHERLEGNLLLSNQNAVPPMPEKKTDLEPPPMPPGIKSFKTVVKKYR